MIATESNLKLPDSLSDTQRDAWGEFLALFCGRQQGGEFLHSRLWDRLSGAEDLLQATIDVVTPQVIPEASDWIERFCRLDDQGEANQGGAYDLDKFPWWREPLNLANNPDVTEVTYMISPQVGKTIAEIMKYIFKAKWRPRPGLALFPTQNDATEFRDRIYANASASVHTADLVPPESKWNLRSIQLGPMTIYLAWAGALNALRSRRAADLLLDEYDIYEGGKAGGDPAESARQRVGAFHSYQITNASSPVEDPSRIAAKFEQSRRHRWHFPCPCCGHSQELRFFPHKDGPYVGRGGVMGIRDKQDALLSPEEAKEKAYYICEKGCRIEPIQKDAMIRKGRWLADGTRLKIVNGQYVLEGTPKGPAWHYGYHFPLIAAPGRSLGEAASDFVTASINGTLAAFWQKWLALSYTTRTKRPAWKKFARNNAADYTRGVVPSAAWFLTCGVDVQEDRIYAAIWAWGDRRTSWLVDAIIRERAAGDDADLYKSDLLQAMQLLKVVYPVQGEKNAHGKSQLCIRRMMLDTGHRPDDVHEIVHHYRKMGYQDRVHCVRGDAKVPAGARWKISKITHNERTKEKYRHVRREIHVNSFLFKVNEAQRMLAPIDKRGSMALPKDIMEWGKIFLQQMVNDAQAIVKGKKTFVMTKPSVGRDFWHASVYARVAAEHFVAKNFHGDWRAESWTSARPEVDSEGVRGRR
jgi:phage terminase large subunit GpA-like protein